jgi:hypothetical protein
MIDLTPEQAATISAVVVAAVALVFGAYVRWCEGRNTRVRVLDDLRGKLESFHWKVQYLDQKEHFEKVELKELEELREAALATASAIDEGISKTHGYVRPFLVKEAYKVYFHLRSKFYEIPEQLPWAQLEIQRGIASPSFVGSQLADLRSATTRTQQLYDALSDEISQHKFRHYVRDLVQKVWGLLQRN